MQAIIYNALISASEKGRLPERALEVLRAMQRHGVVPDVVTLNALISACEKGRTADLALEAF